MSTPASAGGEHGGGVEAGGVVGVEMDGDADFLLEGGDQLVGGVRFAQAGHVLDGEDVGAHALEFLGLGDVVFQRILVALRVDDVAGVADRRLAERLAVFAHGLHGHLHVGQIVERVEDAEDVHAGVRGVFDEAGDDVVRVIRVADRVGAAEEHLEADVRDFFAQAAEAVPGALAEEAHGGVEGRAAPHFQREELRARGGRWPRPRAACRSVRMRVAMSDWWASRKVVSVMSRRFSSRIHWANFSGPISNRRSRVPCGTSAWCSMTSESGTCGLGQRGCGLPALGGGIAVDGDVGQIGQRAVARSRRRLNWNSSGLVSMSLVWAWPARKVSSAMTFSRNGMLVFTPRMRNSRRARSMRWQAIGKSRPIAVSFTSMES